MIPGLAGSLLSHDAVEEMLQSASLPELADAPPVAVVQQLRTWHAGVRGRLGPSSGCRTIFDLVAEPLARILGFDVVPVAARPEWMDALLRVDRVPAAVMVVTLWGQSGSARRHAVHSSLAHGVRWAICFSGPVIRLIDAHRPYAGRDAELDLETMLEHPQALTVMWGLLQAGSIGRSTAGSAALDRAVAFSDGHRARVRKTLRVGVHAALLQLISAFRRASPRQPASRSVLDESLIVIYRILFLLFAEARGLVPAWHPVYRDGYTIEAIRSSAARAVAGAGVWDALQAVARLAHRGCRAGTLRVTPFNGRLFSPADAPLADAVPLDDRAVSDALMALTTRPGRTGLEQISYGDLGVEQLGSVYEHLLDYDVTAASATTPAVLVPTGRRKATGSFYTPRPLTEFLVRRTLAPLVHDASSDRILGLRILDPAMGSGAFLVAACRYLAAAYEQALVREGTLTAGDIGDDDRAAFRRAVAQKCLFGVDVNPMAVQLARLSLWLATLSADRPLSFLDHHLRSGNSLIGASTDIILRNLAPGRLRKKPVDLPLFEPDALQSALECAAASRTQIADSPDDTIEQVRSKERTLAHLNGTAGPLERWKRMADVWCAAWYPRGSAASGRPMFQALLDGLTRGANTLPPHVAEPLLARAREVASNLAFFHWTFEFPEIFCGYDGSHPPAAGFDVILGNPPWEMLRDDGPASHVRELQRFVRASGVYRLQGSGHGNMYQLFLERILGLLKDGGRSGLILPAGLASDHAVGPLRRVLLDRTCIDTCTVLENRDAIFPVHRALKFLLLTFTNGGSTIELPLHAGVRSAEVLDGIPDTGRPAQAIAIPRTLIEQVDPLGLAVPELRKPADLEILSMVACHIPPLGSTSGWGLHFGRELNATDDRPHFGTEPTDLPVLEGKQLGPFAIDRAAVRHTIPERAAAALLNGDATFRRARLGYRDVASSTNRMTLIAAIVPSGMVTTHTIFCLKEAIDGDSQEFLCGIFNSYVANYLVRMRVGTHVTATIIGRLPVPRPSQRDPAFRAIVRLSRSLASARSILSVARLNAKVAALYGLNREHFAHVLDTFPLVPATERAEALRAFEEMTS